MITNIEQIKSAAIITDIVADHITLKPKGKDLVALCPFHTEKSPSFTLHGNRYKCFGCGRSGDSIEFLMEYSNLNYIQAIEFIANKYHIQVEQSNGKPEPPIPRLEKLSPDTIQYFEKRGISNNTLLRFGITEAIEWMPGAQTQVRSICFNYYRDEQLVNIKFRAKGKDFKLNKGSELIFYNIDALQNETECIIVEGEIDCLSLYEAGIYNVISVPNGAESVRLDYLNNCWDKFNNITKIIIATDNDEPGRKLRDELARRLGKDRCYKPEFPNDCKDANDILIKHGKQAVATIIEQSKRFPVDGVLLMDDLFGDVVRYYEHGYPTGFKSGINNFDDLLQFSTGQFTVITGSPGSGKSEFLDYIATSLSRNHEWKFAVCSFENPAAIHVTKLMEKFTGLSFNHRKDQSQRIGRVQFEQAIAFTDSYYQFINISQVDVSIEGILQKCTELVRRSGIRGVIIDPWNYIEHKIPANYTETQYISECLSLIKEFVIKNDVHLFIIAHPRKLQKMQNGKYPVASMYDISGSAHFFNKADNGISIHRDFTENTVDVYVQKVRFSWLGKVGFCSFKFDTFTRQYVPI